MEGSVKRKLLRAQAGAFEEMEDDLAVERRLKVSVNGTPALSLYCSPVMIRELLVGLFMTEGIVKGAMCFETMSIQYGDEIEVDISAEGEVSLEGAAITSGCAGGLSLQRQRSRAALADDFSMEAGALREVFRAFQARSGLYRLTGCVHSAAISDGADILCFAEDIGRHNAVDKVIGYCLLEDIGFRGKVVLTSGRLTSEVIWKCSRWGIPLVVSRAAPTDLALSIAEECGVGVVGFVRGDRMSVYTHPRRIAGAPRPA
ncbi:MAG: formate dehydrogenase accessory sulfurtransferase FdhD [Thermodesulfovibrionales bacterium]